MSLNFVAFADTVYTRSLNRIKQEATTMNVFKNIFCYNENDLDEIFREKHKDKLIHRSRGFGYWVWKPYILLKALNELEMGDFLLYVDVGCKLNSEGRERLFEYVEMTRNNASGICFFDEVPMPEYMWTKQDLSVFLDYTLPEQLSTYQLASTTFLLKKSEKTVELMQEWLNICECQNYHLVDDSPSIIPNHSEFKEHRHDQSILSILCKKQQCVSIPSEIDFPNEWHNNTKYPVHARRLKGFD